MRQARNNHLSDDRLRRRLDGYRRFYAEGPFWNDRIAYGSWGAELEGDYRVIATRCGNALRLIEDGSVEVAQKFVDECHSQRQDASVNFWRRVALFLFLMIIVHLLVSNLLLATVAGVLASGFANKRLPGYRELHLPGVKQEDPTWNGQGDT